MGTLLQKKSCSIITILAACLFRVSLIGKNKYQSLKAIFFLSNLKFKKIENVVPVWMLTEHNYYDSQKRKKRWFKELLVYILLF